MSDAAAASLGLMFLVLLGIVGIGVFTWLRESSEVTPPTTGPESGPTPGDPEKPWWE